MSQFNQPKQTEQHEVIQRLFSKQYFCELSKVCLSLLQDSPDSHEAFTPTAPAIFGHEMITGATRTEVCHNEVGILAMLQGTSRKSIGEEYHNFVKVNPIERTYLTAIQIAELIQLKGSVTLVHAEDTVAIHEDLSLYLDSISQHQLYNPHYQAPPQQDIETLTTLQLLLGSIAVQYATLGIGDSAMAELHKLFSNTTTSIPQSVQLGNNQSQLAYRT